MAVEGQKRGHTFGQPDLFIAAIAALQDLVVVSRDISEFIEAGVPVFDPWAGVFHIKGDNVALKAPATIEAVKKISSES
jgi:toxin FitB